MLFKEFVSEIESAMQQYKSAGLFDDMMIYDMMLDGLGDVSLLPTMRVETILDVRNNRTKLPDGFRSLYSAVKCEPFVATPDCDEPKDILQDFYFYKVRELKNREWSVCNPCDVCEEETCVVEKTYLHDGRKSNFYYNNLQPLKLKLTPHIKKTKCDRDCKNFRVQESPYEISINNRTLYTNFKEGSIFLVYNGFEEDEEGFIIIPETVENNLLKFLKAYVQREILKRIFLNSDNTTNEQLLYQIYDGDTQKYYQRVMGELKMKRVIPELRYDYANRIRSEFQIQTRPNSPGYNRIEFLVT